MRLKWKTRKGEGGFEKATKVASGPSRRLLSTEGRKETDGLIFRKALSYLLRPLSFINHGGDMASTWIAKPEVHAEVQ